MFASTSVRLLIVAVLFGLVSGAAVGCSSPDGVPCDTDDDCFQNETCDGEICRTADNDPAPRNQNGNGDDNGDNGDDAGYPQAPDDVDTDDHACLEDNFSCSPPEHANAGIGFGYRLRNDDEASFGCVSRSSEFFGHSETTESFSLCRGDFHRYEIYLYSCMDRQYYVSADFVAETACWDGYLETDLYVDFPNNEDLDCSSDDVSCSFDDDGSFQIDIRIQETSHSYEQPKITILLEDIELDEIVFDYHVEFEIVEEL